MLFLFMLCTIAGSMSQHSHTEQVENRHEDDSYLTIAERQETEIKILASRFLSYALPCDTAEQFTEALDALRREHYNANHHCYAWRCGFDGSDFRYSDDGEPGGTAGIRIMGSIDRLGLTNTGIIVVRYFGGTKLGMGGLAHAYSDSADAVLDLCRIEKRYLYNTYSIRFPYDMTSQVHHVMEKHGVAVLDRAYLEETTYRIQVRRSKDDTFRAALLDFTQRTTTFPD